MTDRTQDIVRLREAQRLCRLKVAAGGPGFETYLALCAEIEGMIRVLAVEKAAGARPYTARQPMSRRQNPPGQSILSTAA